MCTLLVRKLSGKVWKLDVMLEIFIYELEAKKQACLAVKAQKSRENYTTGAFFQPSSRNRTWYQVEGIQ